MTINKVQVEFEKGVYASISTEVMALKNCTFSFQ